MRHPDLVDEGGAGIGREDSIPPSQFIGYLGRAGARLGAPIPQDRHKAAGERRGDVLLHTDEIVDIEFPSGSQHFANAIHAEGLRPGIVAQRDGVARRQDVVVGGGDVVARRG